MNLRALVCCGASAVALAAEITGANRNWLTILLACALLLAFVSFISGFLEFLWSPRSKWRRFTYALCDIILDDYFKVWESNRRLEGKSFYCHQGYQTTVNCVHSDHLVLETPSVVHGWQSFCCYQFTNGTHPTHSRRIHLDMANETVCNLLIRYDKGSGTESGFLVVDRDNLEKKGLTVVREFESEDFHTYFVDLWPAAPAWDEIFKEPHRAPVHMELEINVKDLNVCFTFDPRTNYCREGLAIIKFKIKGNPEVKEIQKNWGYRETRRFMSYLAYWEKRRCCGVLLTAPFCRFRSSSEKITLVLNVCTVQDLVAVAESRAPLTAVSITSAEPYSHQCIVEGEDFWVWKKNVGTLTKSAEKEAAQRKSPEETMQMV
ncbi:hypothetical protein M758_1G036800 [Ceratodon purpureus]|nr:hypothetical protein M758_1G036800 [Ceratodon purpureus]KAG0628574.1 hypothetical protein M758_1G036800 [Ceratodon purpureus]KAG0628575.1 hypothetical protein M758_1G036800 [Ceratodon purpureus]KAG0628576.1 hypothetical protein M758_1G036800 [Ceratodon purpureus]